MTPARLEKWLETDESQSAEHTGQRPDRSDDELAHSRWAASLKNGGHDPLR
jgi:hypothetical protein